MISERVTQLLAFQIAVEGGELKVETQHVIGGCDAKGNLSHIPAGW